MRDSTQILSELKAQGCRFSRVRKSLLDLFTKRSEPLSSPDIQRLLSKAKISANKTTVYRELAFLKERGLIRELQFGENIKKYEQAPENHHHHIVCVDCDKIEDVELKKDLETEERAIAKNKNFTVLNHSLEFYGVCRKCRGGRML